MRQYYFILYILCFVFCPAEAQEQRLWTLDECMDYAISNNTQIRHLQQEQRRRQINVQYSKDARLPRFNGNVDGFLGTQRISGDGDNRFNANDALLKMGLSGVVPLYTGNLLSSRIKASKYSFLAVSEDMRSAEKAIRIQVAAAYLQLLYNKGEASIARQRQEVSQLLLKRASSLFDKGKRPESDVIEAMTMVRRDEALLTAAEGDIALAKLDLRMLMNLPDSIDFAISEPTDSISPLLALDSLLAPLDSKSSIINSHPAVRSANFGILQAEQIVTTARSGYYPTLSLVGSLGTSWLNLDAKMPQGINVPLRYQGETVANVNYPFNYELEWKNFFGASVGLKLSVPIFNAFETKHRIRTAKANLEDARLAYDAAQQRIDKDIRQAWQGAATAQKRYEAEVKAEESCALSYRYALKRYDAGMTTLFDLSQIRQEWFAASENALRMKYEYLIRKRILGIYTSE